MDGVLEEAAVLCLCKVACSLLFVPSLTASNSPISFCCCCLLIFTDFLVTVFLSFLSIFGSWKPELNPQVDVIALRFLLFLSHTYGVVLLLTTPLIAVETVMRLLWPVVTNRSQTAGSDGQNAVMDKQEKDNTDKVKDNRSPHAVGYLCCLSVWVIVALNVRWRWKVEEVLVEVCLDTTNSLLRCLPNLLSPMPTAVNPCWGLAFLLLLLLLLTSSMDLQRRHREKADIVKHKCWQGLVPASSTPFSPVNPGMSLNVDPEKTESSCNVHRADSWNSVQMSVCHHGDFVLLSPACLSGKRGEQEHERTKRGIPLTFITETQHVDSVHRSPCGWRQWGFPCLGVNVMIGFVGVLSIFVLPLNLSVNILLIRTIETLLELCVLTLISPVRDTRDTFSSHRESAV